MSGEHTDTAGLVAMVVISAIRSVGSGIQTPAVSAVIPQLAPENKLPRVNGFFAGIQSVVQLAAPAAAGAVLAFGSIQSILLIDILTAALGVGLLATLRIPRPARAQQESASLLADMKAGLRYAGGERFLRKLLLVYGAFIFLSVPSGFLVTLMVERSFGADYFYLSTVEILGFAGSALGGLLLGAWGGFKNRSKTLALGLAAYGALSLAVGVVTSFWVFAALMFLIGLAIPVIQTTVTTMVQEKTDPAYMGRMFSLIGVMFSGFMPLGMLLFGPLADVVSVQALVMACGVPLLALAGTVAS